MILTNQNSLNNQIYNCFLLMEPKSTVLNSKKWRIWHTTNYLIGGIFFFFGSILLYQYFTTFTFMNSGIVSAWLYTIGSFCFCLADFTQWTHYQQKVCCNKSAKFCQFPSFSLNFLTSLTGSIIYLIGSAAFLPQINKATQGLYLFIIGSSFIMTSQSWKLLRTVFAGYAKNEIIKQINQDLSGFLVDLFAGVGGLGYFIGSFLFFNPLQSFQLAGATSFSTGGFLFYLSGAFMMKRYFIQKHTEAAGSIKVSQQEMNLQEQKQKSSNLEQTD